MLSRLKLARSNLHHIMYHADMKAIRLVLSLGSLAWAAMWTLAAIYPDSFMADHYVSYRVLRQLLSPLWWALLFYTHFVFRYMDYYLK